MLVFLITVWLYFISLILFCLVWLCSTSLLCPAWFYWTLFSLNIEVSSVRFRSTQSSRESSLTPDKHTPPQSCFPMSRRVWQSGAGLWVDAVLPSSSQSEPVVSRTDKQPIKVTCVPLQPTSRSSPCGDCVDCFQRRLQGRGATAMAIFISHALTKTRSQWGTHQYWALWLFAAFPPQQPLIGLCVSHGVAVRSLAFDVAKHRYNPLYSHTLCYSKSSRMFGCVCPHKRLMCIKGTEVGTNVFLDA